MSKEHPASSIGHRARAGHSIDDGIEWINLSPDVQRESRLIQNLPKPQDTHTHAPFTRLFSDAIVQLYDGYVAPMDDALLGLSEVAPGIADSFASSTSTANTFLIVFGLFGLGR